jgi:hypothetical protein
LVRSSTTRRHAEIWYVRVRSRGFDTSWHQQGSAEIYTVYNTDPTEYPDDGREEEEEEEEDGDGGCAVTKCNESSLAHFFIIIIFGVLLSGYSQFNDRLYAPVSNYYGKLLSAIKINQFSLSAV